MTAPSDHKNDSYFRLLEDIGAKYRLGTLQILPLEIRQQIFMIVLEDHYQDFNERRRRCRRPPGSEHFNNFDVITYTYNALNKSELEFRPQGVDDNCCCVVKRRSQFWSLFDLASYCSVSQDMEKAPLSIRLTSRAIKAEFDYASLTSSTFEFGCPATLMMFLEQLSPLQQSQLRHMRLDLFWYGRSDYGRMGRYHLDGVWKYLPSGLTSVEFVTPLGLEDIYECWTGDCSYTYSNNADALEFAAEVLKESCRVVAKTSPRARISFCAGADPFTKEEQVVLDEVRRDIEPWSKNWRAWMDEWSR